MPYEDAAAVIATVRKREATAALAVGTVHSHRCALRETGMRWSEIDLDKKIRLVFGRSYRTAARDFSLIRAARALKLAD